MLQGRGLLACQQSELLMLAEEVAGMEQPQGGANYWTGSEGHHQRDVLGLQLPGLQAFGIKFKLRGRMLVGKRK